jgi:hypothetical protein
VKGANVHPPRGEQPALCRSRCATLSVSATLTLRDLNGDLRLQESCFAAHGDGWMCNRTTARHNSKECSHDNNEEKHFSMRVQIVSLLVCIV